MANYIINSYTGNETGGDSMQSGNITAPELLIVPNPGYSIRAFDFSIHNATRGSGANINKWTGGSLPDSIESVKFVDQDPNYIANTGYSSDNTIKAIVTFATSFVVTQDVNISLDIDGDAVISAFASFSIPINLDLLADLMATNYNITNLTSGLSVTNNSDGSAVSGTTQQPDINISGTIEVTEEQLQEGEVDLGVITIDIDEDDLPASQDSDNSNTGVIEEVVIEEEEEETVWEDDNVLPQQPGGGFDPGPIGGGDDHDYLEPGGHGRGITLEPTGTTIDTGEGLPSSGSFRLVLNTNNLPSPGQRLRYRLKTKAVSPPVVSNNVIKRVDFGRPEISVNGETRVMRVFGDVGAKVNIGIYTDTGTIGTEDGSETPDIVNITNGEITNNDLTTVRGEGVYSFNVVFPKTTSTKNYGMQISAGSSSSLGSSIAQGGGGGAIYDYVFQQFANPTITINATTSHNNGNPNYLSQLSGLQITRVGVANSSGSSLNSVRGKSDIIPINWTITNVSSPSSPKDLVLDNTVIKDGGFEDGLTHWTAAQLGAGNNTVTHFVDVTNGDYVQRAGSDSNAVTLQQNGVLEIGRQYTFVLEYSGQSKAGGEITIEAGTASSNAQSLTQSAANTRHKIVTTLTAAGNTNLKITLNNDADARVHSITTSSFANSIPEENGGTSLRIISSDTSINSSTVSITGSLKVIRYGNKNATLNVDVAQLFNVAGN